MKRYIEVRPDTKIARLGGRPPRVTLVLLVACVSLFLVYAFADGPPWVALLLAASGENSLLGGRLWQPFTALLLHLGTRGLLFNMLSLWIFGSALERWWGGRRFLIFWVVTGVFGLWAAVLVGAYKPQVVLYGSGGAALAMIIAVAYSFPNHLVFFFGLIPIKAKIFALAIGGFLLLGNLLGGQVLEAVMEGGGALCGLLFLLRPRRWLAELRVKRAKRKFGVIEGGKGKGKKKDEKKYLN